jgi:hypothetical protein
VHSRFLSRVQRQWLISLLLVAVAVRALIPAGFMPSAERPFSFQICPDGFPAQLLHGASAPLGEHAAHHAHDGNLAQHSDAFQHADAARPSEGLLHGGHGSHEHGAARAEHCVFAAAAGVGPGPQPLLLLTALETQAAPQLHAPSPVPELTRYRVQQPRGPPQLS